MSKSFKHSTGIQKISLSQKWLKHPMLQNNKKLQKREKPKIFFLKASVFKVVKAVEYKKKPFN